MEDFRPDVSNAAWRRRRRYYVWVQAKTLVLLKKPKFRCVKYSGRRMPVLSADLRAAEIIAKSAFNND